ncbi:MAG: twin-arginine translocase subunit TatC [Acidimicrobiales bacterium]|nr:twin-arginine translocase subunit TatC [Acidimicrobiales bacterium]MCB1246031.1 twin-arginine translocase subunit TatC [Acidimicrobiia bacterium]
MPLLEHLVELRSRLIKCAYAIAAGAVIGWIVYLPVVDFLRKPLNRLSNDPNVSDAFLSFEPLEQFMLRVKMSGYLGLTLAMPIVLYQLWKFVSPGLYKNERKYALSFVASATLLFALGAAIAYYTLPAALDFLTGVGGSKVQYQYTAESYLMLIVYMMIAFGIGFQFPILLVFLQLVGVVKPKQLSQFRRFAVVIIFVIAAIITPSADPISLFALSIPMVVFYEVSILVGRIVYRRRADDEDSVAEEAGTAT